MSKIHKNRSTVRLRVVSFAFIVAPGVALIELRLRAAQRLSIMISVGGAETNRPRRFSLQSLRVSASSGTLDERDWSALHHPIRHAFGIPVLRRTQPWDSAFETFPGEGVP